jgi:hypothetical protein
MTPSTILALHGIEQSISEWALDYGILPSLIIERLECGCSIKTAITTPMKAQPGQRLPDLFWEMDGTRPPVGRLYTHNGRTMNITAWSNHTGIGVATINYRLRQGMSFDQAISVQPMLRGPNNRQRMAVKAKVDRMIDGFRNSKAPPFGFANFGRTV